MSVRERGELVMSVTGKGLFGNGCQGRVLVTSVTGEGLVSNECHKGGVGYSFCPISCASDQLYTILQFKLLSALK